MSNPSRLTSSIQPTVPTATDEDDGNGNLENWRPSARYMFSVAEQDKRDVVVEINLQSTTPVSRTTSNMNTELAEVPSPAHPPPSQPRDATPDLTMAASLPIASSRSPTPIELVADLDMLSSEDLGFLSSPVLSSITSDIDDTSQLTNGTVTPEDTQDPFVAGTLHFYLVCKVIANSLLDAHEAPPSPNLHLASFALSLRSPDPNISGRRAPNPHSLVKPSVRSGRKFYVVTTGRKVGICNLL